MPFAELKPLLEAHKQEWGVTAGGACRLVLDTSQMENKCNIKPETSKSWLKRLSYLAHLGKAVKTAESGGGGIHPPSLPPAYYPVEGWSAANDRQERLPPGRC